MSGEYARERSGSTPPPGEMINPVVSCRNDSVNAAPPITPNDAFGQASAPSVLPDVKTRPVDILK